MTISAKINITFYPRDTLTHALNHLFPYQDSTPILNALDGGEITSINPDEAHFYLDDYLRKKINLDTKTLTILRQNLTQLAHIQSFKNFNQTCLVNIRFHPKQQITQSLHALLEKEQRSFEFNQGRAFFLKVHSAPEIISNEIASQYDDDDDWYCCSTQELEALFHQCMQTLYSKSAREESSSKFWQYSYMAEYHPVAFFMFHLQEIAELTPYQPISLSTSLQNALKSKWKNSPMDDSPETKIFNLN